MTSSAMCRAKLYGVKLPKPPSEYIRQNVLVTTSGMCSADPLACAISALGHEKVMFAADYPFESAAEAGEFMDHAPLAEPVRNGIASGNAKRLLRLNA
jgi:2,3-dihydroxybenzoate decarboxylase